MAILLTICLIVSNTTVFAVPQTSDIISEYIAQVFTEGSACASENIANVDILEHIDESTAKEVEKNAVEVLDISNFTNKDSSFKAFMDYRTITDTTSKQWQIQQNAYTDINGLRKIDNYYCVALGSSFNGKIGDKFRITFDTGTVIEVIMADLKSDRHTDSSNTFIDLGNGKVNVLEFIVDDSNLPTIVQVMGDISYVPNGCFEGQIIKIERIVI